MNPSHRQDQPATAGRDASAGSSPHASAGGRGEAGPSGGGSAAQKVARGVLASGMGRRPVDVLCAGMYRACSTWQYEVSAHLVEQHRGGRRAGYLTAEEYAGCVPRSEPDRKARRDPEGGWRVLKSHDGHECFARAIAEGRAVAIYAYRDVRDVVFSLMHKRRLTFEQLLAQGMIHQVLANDRFWTRQPNVLVQRYDAILADPVGSVRALAQHLGIRPGAGEAERIAAEYSLEANRARTEALRRQLEQGGVDLNAASNSLICDPATLLHWNHVRDGRPGSWAAEATPEQRLVLHRMCGGWLRSHGYPTTRDDRGPAAPIPIAEQARLEARILRGWLHFRTRQASQRFPRLAAAARRLLGISGPTQAGATVWSESGAPAAGRDRDPAGRRP